MVFNKKALPAWLRARALRQLPLASATLFATLS